MTTDLCFKCSNKDSILCSICGIAKDGAREYFNQKPITNADRIRSMTDEELAQYICKTQYREGDICPPTHRCAINKSCEKCWLDWLKQEVEE